MGSRKLINVPWGFHKQILSVTVPPGISTGKILRLKGIGRIMPDGSRGDLLLKVIVEPE